MSLIEKAVERLDQLKRAEQAFEENAAAPVETPPTRDPRTVPADAVDARELTDHAPHPVARSDRASEGAHSNLVTLDLERLDQLGMVTPIHPKSVIAEEYRVVKRPLIRNAQGRSGAPVENGNLIMVTSSLPGEGKSFTAMNLAMSIAMELDNTVLLVDADFARPSILQRFGLPPRKGLMDVLVGDVADLSEVMLRTSVEKLSILPAGMTHQRSTELIASDAMTRLLEEMATRYAERIILFDSPPLLSTTEARVLASHMGQVVMVVESERTTHGAVKQALATIENCPVKLLVLNKATEGGRGGVYGYGYGYGYGRAHGSDFRADASV